MNNYVIYQAYGKEEILYEAIYSILHLLNIHKFNLTFKIIIVTDNVAYFENFLEPSDLYIYEAIAPEKIKLWRGAIDFVHRVKIEVLQFVTSKYLGNFLYADTDIFFLQPINELFDKITNGIPIMCFKEWSIQEGPNVLYKRLNKFIKSDKNTSAIKPSTIMYNAGILGFNSSFTPQLENVKKLTDSLHPLHPIFIIEQLAFSYYLQKQGGVYETEKTYTFHYWNFKEFREALASIFEYHKEPKKVIEQMLKLNVQEMREPKRIYEALPSWQRKWMRLFNKKWQMPAFEK